MSAAIPVNQAKIDRKALSAIFSLTVAGTLTICAPTMSPSFQPKPFTLPYSFIISAGALSGVLWHSKQLLSSTLIGALTNRDGPLGVSRFPINSVLAGFLRKIPRLLPNLPSDPADWSD